MNMNGCGVSVTGVVKNVDAIFLLLFSLIAMFVRVQTCLSQ